MSENYVQDDQGYYPSQYPDQGYGQQQQPNVYDPNMAAGYSQTGAGYDQQEAGYDIGDPNFGGQAPGFPQDPQFQQFDYSSGGFEGQDAGGMFYSTPQTQQVSYTGSIMTPDAGPGYTGDSTDNFDDEPPLLEELGINFDHILQKTIAVLNPLKETDASVIQDADLAGPLVFCLAFGGSLLLAGKVHFGYIYGIGVVGCLAMYALLNLMSLTGVSTGCTISVLGYCLLPMVLLSFLAVVLSLQGLIGVIATAATVLWCSVSASKLFVSALAMDHQQLLVAYPCALVYGVFALLTVF